MHGAINIKCDICELQFGFHPVAVVGKIVHKQKINNYIHGEQQYTKNTETQNTQNIKQTYKTRKQASLCCLQCAL